MYFLEISITRDISKSERRFLKQIICLYYFLPQGLTIVDVYSEWSGPCSAMTNFLKKIKLEVNDDLLSYAMAKSDTIPQLEIFRGQCKPIWLFMATGIIVKY